MQKYLIFCLFLLLSLTFVESSDNGEVNKEFVVKNWLDRLLLWLFKRAENQNEKPMSICSLSLYPPFKDIQT
jgi:hypothetical protein